MSPLSIDLDSLWVCKPTQAKSLQAIRNAPDMGMVAYVGSLGSGKTWTVCRTGIGVSLAYPGIKGLIGRYHGTDLRDTTEAEFFKLIGQLEEAIRSNLGDQASSFHSIGTWKAADRNYIFNNGSIIHFRPLQEAEEKYKSLEISWFGIDEGSEVAVEGVMMLQARIRQRGYPHFGFIVSNPTDFDHWLYRWFVEDPQPGYRCFQTNTLENIDNLPPNYIDTLRQKYPAAWVNRYLKGEWGSINAQAAVFPTFDINLHVKPLSWTKRYPILVGIDWGYQYPAIVWSQIDPQNRLKVIRSWAPTDINVYKLAEGVKLRNGEWFPNAATRYFAGHDGNTRKDTGEKTSAEVFRHYGMDPYIRYTHIERGFSTIRSLLDTRDDKEPALYVDPINTVLIRGFGGGYRYHPTKEGEVEKTGIYDPLFDALRYIVVNNYNPGGRIVIGQPISAFVSPRFHEDKDEPTSKRPHFQPVGRKYVFG